MRLKLYYNAVIYEIGDVFNVGNYYASMSRVKSLIVVTVAEQ